MARVVFIKFAQQIVMLGLVRVPYRTFPQRKKHGASHFVGVDKGNQFLCGSSASPRLMMEA